MTLRYSIAPFWLVALAALAMPVAAQTVPAPDQQQQPQATDQTPPPIEVSGRMVKAAERAIMLNPGDSRALYLGAINLERLGESERALEWADRALRLDPKHPVMLYNLACFHSVAGRVDIAIDHVERALELGFLHKEWYLTDSDLENIRDLPRFKQLISEKFRDQPEH